jgi:endonuclease YncB( thermonuclease family)
MSSEFDAKIIGIVILIIIFIFVLKYSEYFFPNQKTFCKGNFTAIVKRIIDGDTIELQECNEHIRLSLVNTPEYYQPGYKEAKDFTANLCKVGSHTIIYQDELQPYDKYGRIVALVICQNKKLNAELVYNNLGSILARFCSASEFSNEEWANC